MKYNPDLLAVRVEPIKIEDPKLMHSLGDEVSRLIFEVESEASAGDLSLEITEAKR